MTNAYLYRVLAAVQALALQGERLTVRAVQRAMGVDSTTSSGAVAEALDVLRCGGYVAFEDTTVGTLRYTEPQVYGE